MASPRPAGQATGGEFAGLAALVTGRVGGLDILVNNAGVSLAGAAGDAVPGRIPASPLLEAGIRPGGAPGLEFGYP